MKPCSKLLLKMLSTEKTLVIKHLGLLCCIKPLLHSSQKLTRKLAANAFKYCDWMKVLAARLPVGFCDEWKRALKCCTILHTMKKNG